MKEIVVMPKKENHPTLGYPTLEKLIEVEDPHTLGFAQSRATLDQIAHKGATPEEKTRARQATLAYDRFMHFFEEMIELRDKMYNERESQKAIEKTKKKKK